jgi:hypothetical protein
MAEWIANIIALASCAVAIIAARTAIKEAQAKAEDAKKHSEALETVIKAAGYLQYLKGVDGSIVSAVQQLESIAKRTGEITELASRQIQESIGHLRNASLAAEEIAKQLRQIGSVTLRAQRDSVKAHKELLQELGAAAGTASDDPFPPGETAPEPGAAADGGRDAGSS